MQFEDLVDKVISKDHVDRQYFSDLVTNLPFVPCKVGESKVEVIKCKNCEKKDKEIEELKQKLNLALEMAQINYEKYCNLLKGE